MRMNIKQFFNNIASNWYRPALPPASAASLTLRPSPCGGDAVQSGRIDHAIVTAINVARQHSSLALEVDAVVFSYGTPIAFRAWFNAHNHAGRRVVWIVPRASYSVTTTRHQNRMRASCGQRMDQWPWQFDGIAKVADIYGF